MNITGIVVEYNPFHKGHLYHIQKTREITQCDGIVAVMSGNFVQRGIPAVIDKWTRTKMALMNGVDLVIELPSLYSLSSAEFFSNGAVSILNNLGIVNNLCFGSEYGSTDLLNYISNIYIEEPIEFKKYLKENLNLGLAYPDARSKALIKFIKNGKNKNLSDLSINEIISSPNNILGIEYCKSLRKLKSSIKTFSIKREGSSYNSTCLESNFSSATSIRKYIKYNKNLEGIKPYVPENIYELLLILKSHKYNFVFEDSMLSFLKYKSILYGSSIEKLPDVSEGIHNRIYKFLNKSGDFNELITSVKTKRYTYTRISRILCQFFIGFENFNTYELRKITCPYARILGATGKGIEILKLAKSKASIPIYTKLPKNLNEVLSLDIQSTKAYSLLNSSVNAASDHLISPIILK